MHPPKHHLLASALLAVAALLAAFAMCASASASASAPLKITNCNKAVSRPSLLTLACGDGNAVLKGASWSSFGGSTAQGKGTFVVNSCEPNCAAGKNLSYPAKAKATGALKCKGGVRVYAKLTLQFSGRQPGPGVPRTWKLGCPT